MSYRCVKLKEVTTKIGSGATPRGGEQAYKESGISLIRSQNVYDFDFQPDGLAFIDEDQAEQLSNVEVQPGDILLNITGHSVGRCCLVPRDYLPARVNQHVSIIRTNEEVDSRYLLYYLNNPRNKTDLLQRVHGGTRKALTKGIIENFEVEIPSLSVQYRIAEILGRLDDKVRVNRRINQTLEETAQTIYRHWFVEFGPFQDSEFVECEFGLIPKKWKVISIKTLNDTLLGGDWGKAEPQKSYIERVRVIRGTDFSDLQLGQKGECPERYIKLSSLEKRQLKPGDIIIENSVNASTRAVGSTLLITEGMLDRFEDGSSIIPASFCRLLRLNEPKLAPLVYLQLSREYETGELIRFQNIASNGIGNFQSRQFEREFVVLLPPERLLDEFLQLVYPLLNNPYIEQNHLLVEIRDYLLPKLISGEISVEATEETVLTVA